MSGPPRQRISPAELRMRFSAGNYLQRAQDGEFTPVLKAECNPTGGNESPGTRSQVLEYLDRAGARAFVVHRYLRPDGSFGGSGRPDPKLLVEGGIIYYTGPEKRRRDERDGTMEAAGRTEPRGRCDVASDEEA